MFLSPLISELTYFQTNPGRTALCVTAMAIVSCQVDKLQMTDCFRNGDFVRAQAASMLRFVILQEGSFTDIWDGIVYMYLYVYVYNIHVCIYIYIYVYMYICVLM